VNTANALDDSDKADYIQAVANYFKCSGTTPPDGIDGFDDPEDSIEFNVECKY